MKHQRRTLSTQLNLSAWLNTQHLRVVLSENTQRRDGKRNPQKHKKKDPGIPNSWPFKQQMLQDQELQREKDIDSLQLAKETRKKERAVRRAQEQELSKAMKQNAQQRRQGRRQRASFAPLPDVLSEADVVLVVLDARDPAACRSRRSVSAKSRGPESSCSPSGAAMRWP